MAINEVWMGSPHYSTSRGPYNKIAFHTTQGAMKIRDLGAWFQNPGAYCSSHHGADNYEAGVLGAYVYENYSAWTQGNANGYCLSLEMCAYAEWSRDVWLGQKNTLLNNSADWLRYCVDKYDIPWTLLNNTQAQDPGVRGICQHINFGSWGSGHVDCGSGFPMDEVIRRAQGAGSSAIPTPTEDEMVPAIAYWGEKLYRAKIGTDSKIYWQDPGAGWKSIDPGANAKGGLAVAISESGHCVVTYINASNEICSYDRAPGANNWGWSNQGKV
jgi:hypothetical protein